MINQLLRHAVLAGLGAGLVASALQLWFVQPVLLYAELFESGHLTHFGSDGPGPGFVQTGGIDPARDALTVVFTSFIYIGWSLVLVALMSFAAGRGVGITARTGMIWGVAGFATAILAPAFTAAPALPGAATIAIEVRQLWWLATVLSTGLGLWLLAFWRHGAALGVAVALLLAPHAVGLPNPDYFLGPAPPELGALMAARVVGVGFVAWVVLGALAGHLAERDLRKQATESA